MNEKAPTGFPPILLDIDYATLADAKLSAPAEVAAGQLIVRGGGPNTIGGHPFSDTGYQDFTLDASVTLANGGDHDLAGIFLRQSTATNYVAMAISPAGYIYVATIADGIATPAAEGPLTPNIPFQRGVGVWNRVTVVAFGPSLVFVLNGQVLIHLAVDQRYKSGFCGLFLQQGGESASASAAARWVQVRAILADQK